MTAGSFHEAERPRNHARGGVRPAFSGFPAARLSPNKTVSVQAQESQSPFASGPRAMISFKLDF